MSSATPAGTRSVAKKSTAACQGRTYPGPSLFSCLSVPAFPIQALIFERRRVF